MKHFVKLEETQEFNFVMYTGGGNYRVCVDIDNVAYLLSDDCIMHMVINDKKLNSKSIEILWNNDSDEMHDSDNFRMVAEWDNSLETFKFDTEDKRICSILFDKICKFRTVIGFKKNPTHYHMV